MTMWPFTPSGGSNSNSSCGYCGEPECSGNQSCRPSAPGVETKDGRSPLTLTGRLRTPG
jgi:hypothetical protein